MIKEMEIYLSFRLLQSLSHPRPYLNESIEQFLTIASHLRESAGILDQTQSCTPVKGCGRGS